MEGLVAAIAKMQDSVDRDQKDLDTMIERNQSGQGSQIEAQLREVRGKLIKERLSSKQEKLTDMKKTLNELEDKQKRFLAKAAKEESKAAKALATKTEELPAEELKNEEDIPVLDNNEVAEVLEHTEPTEVLEHTEPREEISPKED